MRAGHGANVPPLHTRVRKLIMGAFTRRTIADTENGLVALVDRLLDDIEAHGGGDLITDYASAIPVEIIGIWRRNSRSNDLYAPVMVRPLQRSPRAVHERGNAQLEIGSRPSWASRRPRSAAEYVVVAGAA